MAALRAGADIVTMATPHSAAEAISCFSPNLIVQELSGNHLCPEDVDILRDQISRHDVVVMSMGRNPDTKAALEKIIPFVRKKAQAQEPSSEDQLQDKVAAIVDAYYRLDAKSVSK
jgi:NAD(P)H-hydrate repair Nnr-like enzyme with NAD(P)H-hydrate dehydratase domain